jgi:hypothetical protein
LLSKNEGSSGRAGGLLALGGVLLGPSVGYFYGGCTRQAVTGIAIRTGLLAIMGIAASQAEFPSLLGSDDEGNAAAGITMIAFCGVGVATVVDLAQVSGTVRRQNDRCLDRQPTITPTVRVMDHSKVPVFGFTATF